MTLKKFERLLKRINPKLRLRHRGYGDIVGVYAGTGHVVRMTKGELHMNGYRYRIVNPKNKTQYLDGPIQKRGRKTVINILRNYRWVKNHRQRSMLTWGIVR